MPHVANQEEIRPKKPIPEYFVHNLVHNNLNDFSIVRKDLLGLLGIVFFYHRFSQCNRI